jgi:hypothetical protein
VRGGGRRCLPGTTGQRRHQGRHHESRRRGSPSCGHRFHLTKNYGPRVSSGAASR